MLILNRQLDETVMIGDDILVTVVSISPEMATLHVCYDDSVQHVEQKCALEVDDRVEITDEIHVSLLDIRGGVVRLGVVAPKNLAVHRKEIFDSLARNAMRRATTRRPSRVHCVTLRAGQRVRIGESLAIHLHEIAQTHATLKCQGEIIGGADDGKPIDDERSIAVGTVMEFGTLVQVRVAEQNGTRIGLRIEHPTHIMLRKE